MVHLPIERDLDKHLDVCISKKNAFHSYTMNMCMGGHSSIVMEWPTAMFVLFDMVKMMSDDIWHKHNS